MPFALDSSPELGEISDAINYLLANFGANLAADPNTGQISGPSGVVVAYLYKYLAIKYADSFDGSSGFSDSPTDKEYYGINNSNSNVESTNPADYIWYKVAGGGFGTTKFLYYQVAGGRQIYFVIDTAAPDDTYLQAGTSAIDLDVITTATAYQNASPTIYQWTSSSTAPARPTTTTTYYWNNGAYAAPSGWFTTIPLNTTPGDYLWAIKIPLTVVSTTETSTLDWTNTAYAIYVASKNGNTGPTGASGSSGATGPRSSFIYFYNNTASATAPTAPTTSEVSYNFTTNTASTTASGWSTTFSPSALSTTSANNKYWAISVTFSEITYGGSQNTPVITGPFNWENFNGLVTFTNLSTGQNASGVATTYIDGGTITTDTLVVNTLKNNTSGYYNTWVQFALGTNASIGSYQGGGAFTSLNSDYFGLLARNPMGGFGIGSASSQTVSPITGAIVAVGSANSAASTYKNAAILGTGVSAGTFQSNGANNLQDGTLADIRLGYYNGTTTYAYYVVSGAAYPFTAGHDALQLLTEAEPEVGDLMADISLFAAPTVNDGITVMSKSTSANQKGIVGVFVGSTGTTFVPASLGEYVDDAFGAKNQFVLKPEYANIYDTYRCIGVNAIGEGKINVCGQGGDILIGDFIVASDISGKGMKQSDDVFHSYTVAKSRENVTFSSPTEVKQIACIYMGG